eukprot:1952854-Amphidinium_carterae.2
MARLYVTSTVEKAWIQLLLVWKVCACVGRGAVENANELAGRTWLTARDSPTAAGDLLLRGLDVADAFLYARLPPLDWPVRACPLSLRLGRSVELDQFKACSSPIFPFDRLQV